MPPYKGEIIPLPGAKPYTGKIIPLPGAPDENGITSPAEAMTMGGDMTARDVAQRADDYVRNLGNSATFGMGDRIAAAGSSLFGGTYADNLAAERAKTEASRQRLGAATIFPDIAGGLLTGSAAGRAGLTALGRLPATAPLSAKILAGAGEGAAYGALTGAGHTDDLTNTADLTKNMRNEAVLGALTGGTLPAIVAGARRIVSPLATNIDPVRDQAMRTLASEGVDVSAGQRTGSPRFQRLEKQIGATLFGRDPTEGQMRQVTGALMDRAGLEGDRATTDVVRDGFRNTGQQIGSLYRQYRTQFDNQMIQDLSTVQQDARVLPESDQRQINEFINRILQPGASLDPEAMQAIRTDLRLSRQLGPDARPLFNRAINGLQETMDNALERTIARSGNPGDIDRLNTLRTQYAHLHLLADALRGSAGGRAELTPSALAGALSRNVGRLNYAQGRGDLNDLAHAAEGYLPPPRSSGTPEGEGVLSATRTLTGMASSPFVNSRLAQRYWGNQALAGGASGAATQPAVPGLMGGAANTPGLTDRIINGLLGVGP